MEKICKNCTWSYSGSFGLLCSWHHNSLGNDVSVRPTATCDDFTPQDTSGEIRNNGGGCFLTSACVEFMGLPDNCHELTILRAFRDDYLSTTEKGKQLVDKYYAIAPAIVDKIERKQNKKERYDYIYQVVLKCVEEIEKGNNENAVSIYADMVQKLQEDTIND